MARGGWWSVWWGLLAAALALSAPRAQSRDAPFESSYLEPLPSRALTARPPRLSFQPLAELPLPGPLPAAGPVLAGERIRIPVADGVARVDWTGESGPQITPATAGRDDDGDGGPSWVESPDGRRRYAAGAEGRILAQKRCRRCRHGWRMIWNLRVAGGTVTPPLVTARRIYFGALDNRVYALRRRNGHRLWVTDVEGRVQVRPVLLERPGEPDVLLVVPGNGERLIALSAESGERLATVELQGLGERLVGRPVGTPDGKVVVARQGYRDAEASLLVFELAAVTPDAPP